MITNPLYLRSRLIIGSAVQEDYGQYVCAASLTGDARKKEVSANISISRESGQFGVKRNLLLQ